MTNGDVSHKLVVNHIIKVLKDAGMSPAGIAGIMGNLYQESGFSPTAQNPNGAYGIAQWMGSRADALRAYAAATGGKMDSLDTQLGFLVKESTDMGTWQKMVNAKSASDAATIWEGEYERSGGSAINTRISIAEQILKGLNDPNFDWTKLNPASWTNTADNTISSALNPFKDIASAIGAAFGGIKTITDAITSRAWWKRIGLGLVGVLLIAMAIIETQKGTITSIASKAV